MNTLNNFSPPTRQEYKDSTLDEAIAAGCDCVQLKHDGWWCCNRWDGKYQNLFSQTGRHFDTIEAPWRDEALLIGEAMYGTQWAQDVNRKGFIYLFDLWDIRGRSLRTLPYAQRMIHLRSLLSICPINTQSKLKVIQTYPISHAKQLWETYVTSERFEGLVYRRTSDPVDVVIHREKFIITETLRFHRYTLGKAEGRHAHRIGAIVGVTEKGVEVSVGGGLSDADRDSIIANPSAYIGRYFDVEARARFASGSLRHPNFVCWRDDKS